MQLFMAVPVTPLAAVSDFGGQRYHRFVPICRKNRPLSSIKFIADEKCISGVVDAGKKFMGDVVDTGKQFIGGVVDTGDNIFPVTGQKYPKSLKFICVNNTAEYLREFAKKKN
jgi:hypothetical protein